jgi:hypothetical protein
MSANPGPEVWKTIQWNKMTLVKKFKQVTSSGFGSTPKITVAFDKLCLFMYDGSMYEYSGKMLFLDNGDNFSPCSELPVSEVVAPVEFLKRLFIVGRDEIWVSK